MGVDGTANVYRPLVLDDLPVEWGQPDPHGEAFQRVTLSVTRVDQPTETVQVSMLPRDAIWTYRALARVLRTLATAPEMPEASPTRVNRWGTQPHWHPAEGSAYLCHIVRTSCPTCGHVRETHTERT